MLSKEIRNAFQEKWYSFEEIVGIEKGMKESLEWKVFSQKEIEGFIQKELFAKYTTNV